LTATESDTDECFITVYLYTVVSLLIRKKLAKILLSILIINNEFFMR
jgi:hypothetical protein